MRAAPAQLPDLVVLDRDGVVSVEVAGWVSDPDDLVFESNAVAGARRLAAHAIALAVATNQSGIGRGIVSAEAVDAVHQRMTSELRDVGVELTGVHVCPHVDADRCRCRKPAPGLILDAMRAVGADPERTWFVGDMLRDLCAGRAAGVHVALVRTGKGRAAAAELEDDTPVFDDLAGFAAWLLGEETP